MNGFFLYSILLDKAERNEPLILSTTEASQRDRLREALAERNKRMEGVGQEEYGHACDLCFVVFNDEQGRPGACSAISFNSTFINDAQSKYRLLCVMVILSDAPHAMYTTARYRLRINKRDFVPHMRT